MDQIDPMTGQLTNFEGTVRTSGLAVTSLVCGIVGLVLSWVPVLDLVLGAIAIVFGAIGMAQSKNRGVHGRGMAIAGLVMGILTVAVFVALVVATAP